MRNPSNPHSALKVQTTHYRSGHAILRNERPPANGWMNITFILILPLRLMLIHCNIALPLSMTIDISSTFLPMTSGNTILLLTIRVSFALPIRSLDSVFQLPTKAVYNVQFRVMVVEVIFGFQEMLIYMGNILLSVYGNVYV